MISEPLGNFLEWDSNFFGCRIGRVHGEVLNRENATAIDNWAQQEKIDCLYFLADENESESIQIAEDFNYRLQDIRLEFDYPLSKQFSIPALADGYEIRPALPSDTESLIPLTQNSFVVSRFYNDPHFREKAESFYEIWLRRSIEKSFADEVFIITKDSEASAFISCKLSQNSGSIGLVGVAEAARGKQLGNYLVLTALDYFRKAGMEQATVVTQGRNIAAQRLYQACGFRTAQMRLWYHKWF